MNILHLESSPGWGGQEIRSLNEAKGMRGRGHAVFFAIEKNGGLVKRATEENFKVYELKFKKAFWFANKLQSKGYRCSVLVYSTHRIKICEQKRY